MPSGRPLSTIGVSMADNKDLRWIDEYGDDLTMAIATRDWDEAVKLMEKGQALQKSASGTAHDLIASRLESLRPPLLTQMLYDLSSPDIRKTPAARLVFLLTRLDASDAARDTFLQTRRQVMLKRIRSIRCEGDTSIYISELGIVCFTVIRHTSDWYMSAFKENRMASGMSSPTDPLIDRFHHMGKDSD
jgi:hypothetical protein